MKKLAGFSIAVLLAVLVGCATAPKKQEAAVFFPPAPEAPRIQYLT